MDIYEQDDGDIITAEDPDAEQARCPMYCEPIITEPPSSNHPLYEYLLSTAASFSPTDTEN